MEPKKKYVSQKKKEQAQRKLSSLLALDFASSGVKAVRLKKHKGRVALTGAEILPSVNPEAGERPDLPKSLSSYYTSICTSLAEAQLRVFGHVMGENEALADAIRSNMSVPEDYRVAGRMLAEGKGKRESSILGVAFPESAIRNYLDLFAEGAPAPHSMEVSGLAAFNAFLYTRGKQTAGQTVCLLEIGMSCTYIAFLQKNRLQLVSRFDTGGEAVRRQVQTALGIDADMAGTIMADDSVDVSAPVRAALAPFVKQLSIYREYVERQTRTPLSGVYMSGGEAVSPHWQKAVLEVTGLTPVAWNPFEKLDGVADVFPETLVGQESRFAAAVGAALAGLEAI